MKGSDFKRIAEDLDDDCTIVLQSLGEIHPINSGASGLVGDKDESFLVLNADDEQIEDDELFKRCLAVEE